MAPKNQSQQKKSGKFIAGMVAGGVLVAGAAVDVGIMAYNHGPELYRRTQAFIRGEKAPVVVADLIQKPMYLHIRNEDGTIQSWKFTAKGLTTITGELYKPTTATKGVLSGYYRAGTLVLTYASASASRPGYGQLVLQPVTHQQEDQATIYVGSAVVHDCQCAGEEVANTRRLLSGPALLSTEATPSNVHRAKYLDGKVDEYPSGFPDPAGQRRADAQPKANGG